MMLDGVGCGGGTGAGTADGTLGGSDDGDCADIPGVGIEAAGVPTGVPAEFAAGVAVAFSVIGATLILPNLNPESCSARLAVPSGCPMKLGITYA